MKLRRCISCEASSTERASSVALVTGKFCLSREDSSLPCAPVSRNTAKSTLPCWTNKAHGKEGHHSIVQKRRMAKNWTRQNAKNWTRQKARVTHGKQTLLGKEIFAVRVTSPERQISGTHDNHDRQLSRASNKFAGNMFAVR